MLHIVDQNNRNRECAVLRAMFEARKQVFVDLLRWDLPVLAGRYEVDHFDDGQAIYLIVTDCEGEHLASARLLATTRPALLDSLFPDLVEGPVPRGSDIFEITRFCLSRGVGAGLRRKARDLLLVGLVQYGLDHGIRSYTGVAELPWFKQIARFGWDCRALGAPQRRDGRTLTALRIEVDDEAIDRLAARGIGSGVGVMPAQAA